MNDQSFSVADQVADLLEPVNQAKHLCELFGKIISTLVKSKIISEQDCGVAMSRMIKDLPQRLDYLAAFVVNLSAEMSARGVLEGSLTWTAHTQGNKTDPIGPTIDQFMKSLGAIQEH